MNRTISDMQPLRTDVLIAGGGTAGLALAVALKRSAPGLAVTIADGSAGGAPADDGRSWAIAAAACRMLDELGVWPELAAVAQPIREVIVTDGRGSDAARPVFLTFDATTANGEPVAHMIPNSALNGALAAAAARAGVEVVKGAPVADFSAEPGDVVARTPRGTWHARLLVAADGGNSRLRDLAGIRTIRHDYRQKGLVTTVRHERPHHGRAEEHFLPAGPFAILPLRGRDGAEHRSSLVWTERPETADELVTADAATFEAALDQRFGRHLGRVRDEGPRHAYPLRLILARDFVRPRLALCGDAAHVVHPLAGQGLNLGLRDVAALAETIVEAARLGLDFGTLAVLERYERWRRFDTLEMAMVTDGLNRLFSTDMPVLRFVRDVGLGLVDRVPLVKRALIGAAAGNDGGLPRLLRGEPL